jgi:hypothetical protein
MSIRDFKIFGFQIDLARQIERPEVICNGVSGMAQYGYNVCQLYLEDAYQFPRHPEISRKNAYHENTIQNIAKMCSDQGIELIPVIPSLGHCQYITSKRGYAHLDEGAGTEIIYGTVSPSFEKTYDVLRELYEDWCLHVPGKYLHVALDESASMGQHHIRTFGETGFDRVRMFATHCNRLNAISKSLNRRMIMWGDMLFYLPQAMELLDKDIIIQDWYYYSFEETPRVELFNFSKIDLSGDLKRAGFEVWGVPSIWPNKPIAPIEDRWKNLNDWVRYGRERGIDGILITDWENSTGFYSMSDMLFRAFGRGLNNSSKMIQHDLLDVIDEITQYVGSKRIIDDLLRIGDFHITGFDNRDLLFLDPACRANYNRYSECCQKHEQLARLFESLPDLAMRAASENGRYLLTEILLCHQFLKLVWKIGAQLPLVYNLLCAASNEQKCMEVASELSALADEIERFSKSYFSHWEKVRYADDPCPVKQWADKTTVAFRQWAKEIGDGLIEEHSLLSTPRIEFTMHCHHPAWPGCDITAIWEDGHIEKFFEALLCFDSQCAEPELKLRQYMSIPLQRRELPKQIRFSSVYYGQIGIEQVFVIHRGKSYSYTPMKMEGQHACQEKEIIWLGPICSTIESPLMRNDEDIVVFERL